MKLIATVETFSYDNQWIEYEIYKHGSRYRIQSQECELGGISYIPERRWGTIGDVRHILTMDDRDLGIVTYIDEIECHSILT